MRLKLWQYFCKHDFDYLIDNVIVNERLFKCNKCGIYRVRHDGLWVEYKSKNLPSNKGWTKG